MPAKRAPIAYLSSIQKPQPQLQPQNQNQHQHQHQHQYQHQRQRQRQRQPPDIPLSLTAGSMDQTQITGLSHSQQPLTSISPREPISNADSGASIDNASSVAKDRGDSAPAQKNKRKKRKTVRACNHCQKSHLTCDDSRPCARCVKKGIGATCIDGVRKKAKYLLEADELAEFETNSKTLPADMAAGLSKAPKIDVPAIRQDIGGSANAIDAITAKPEMLRSEQQQQQRQGLGAIPQLHATFSSQAAPSAGLTSAMPPVSPLTSLPPTSLAAAALQQTPTTMGFGSEAINLEYAILSSMLSYPMFANSALNPAAETPDIGPVHAAVSNQLQIDQANVSGISPVISGSSATLQSNGTVTIPSALWAQPLPQSQQQQQQQQQVTQEEAALHAAQATTELAGVLPQSSPSTSQQQHQPSSDTQESIVVAAAAAAAAVSATGQPMPPQQDSWQRRSFMHDLPQPQQQQQQQQQQSVQGINTGNTSSIYNHQQQYQQITSTLIKTSPPPPHTQIVADEPHHPLSRPPTSGPAVYGLNPVYPQSPAEVYSAVNEPYKYYNGFHYFFRHIRGCMDKRDIMRVSRAIAHFRPSLVALLRNLTREDLIFMEKSFQRALMEYEKLIGFTGTPTVVWRRTGEIALVGKEFSILTQWDRQSLITGNKFIFELMDTESAVTYWEQFAVHAFENSEHSVMSECRLVRPDGASVPCAFSFTIKRDLFGIPMAIIGNFLPIL